MMISSAMKDFYTVLSLATIATIAAMFSSLPSVTSFAVGGSVGGCQYSAGSVGLVKRSARWGRSARSSCLPKKSKDWKSSLFLASGKGSDAPDVPNVPNVPDVPEVYPLSRRKVMLIEEAKKLDDSMASGAKVGSYSPTGWSNRLGSVLTPAAIPGVYTADRPFYWNKIDVGCRMTVVQIPPSTHNSNNSSNSINSNNSKTPPELIIHSPVALDPPLIQALQPLGTVTHVISPNYEHVKYAHQWAEYYKEAKIWGCPGMMEREEGVRWTGEIREGARPPCYPGIGSNGGNNNEMWDWNQFQPLHIDTEVNPFTGRPFFNEVIFYHAASKSLLMTDLYWNYPRGDGVTNGQVLDDLGVVVGVEGGEEGRRLNPEESDFGPWELAPEVGEIPLGSKLWKVGMDKLFYPFYMNFMVKPDAKDKFKDIAKFITCGNGESGWEVETIIPAHGDIVRGKALCRKVLERHFNIRCTSS